jgi:hypothetical protein
MREKILTLPRNKDIQGTTMIDFTDKGLKYIRILYGLSGLRQYQLREMMRKLYKVYRGKGNRRNFLISPDVFSYLFDENYLENKVKSGLLLLSKDLEGKYRFPVFYVRPKSLFTRNFVNLLPEIEKQF